MRAVLAAAILSIAASAHGQTLPDGRSTIVDPSKCAAAIGAGGNLKLRSGVTLQGKCEGAGEAPTLVDSDQGKVIEFAVRGNKDGDRDRTELAFTERNHRLQYGREYRISFEVNIPDGASATDQAYYLAQLWQSPTVPPFAGLRVRGGKIGLLPSSFAAMGLNPAART